MPGKLLTLDDVLDLVRDGVVEAGSQQYYADFAGVSRQHLSGVLRGRWYPSAKLLRYLDLMPAYRRKVNP